MLVGYSDSEGSEDEQPPKTAIEQPPSKTKAQSSASTFAVDRSTGKIKVNLQNKLDPSTSTTHDDEPAAKRPRLGAGGGAFSNFNAMLPAPKRDNLPPAQNGGTKAPARKVFSLRTGAEPAFSRESDAELRDLFAEQAVPTKNGSSEKDSDTTNIPPTIPKPAWAKPAPPAAASTGKPFMFKPLSVARGSKKKSTNGPILPPSNAGSISKSHAAGTTTQTKQAAPPDPPKKKINLFSSETETTQSLQAPEDDDDEDEIIEDLGPLENDTSLDSFTAPSQSTHFQYQPQSLDSIATDLNLSAAERRQLFGRHGASSNSNALNVVNFNTDAEYAANQALINAGETVQHNPVRAIAGGKHSLRQLVGSAMTQKDALEESFATGRRNKKEAGNKYGW